MGYTRWDEEDWVKYSKTTSTKTRKEIFTSSRLDDDLNPKGVLLREARDSDLNPKSTPLITAVDVTGSMGKLAETIVRKGLGVLFKEILDRKPISDPQIMSMAIGDATMWDRAPLQVSQFEADLTAAKWLEKIYIEGGGGGNHYESYDLPYYFAAKHTSIDSFEKRGKKGYLFTVGDEEAPPVTTFESVRKFISEDGDGLQTDIPFKDVIEMASKMYHCFHIIIAQGWYASGHPGRVKESWRELLGQNAIWLTEYEKLGETIVSIIQVTEGADKDKVIKSWDGSTSMVVRDAIKNLNSIKAYDDANKVIML